MAPIPDCEPALAHEHHAAPAADIRDRAFFADEKGLVLHGIIDKRQRRLGARAELGDNLVVHLAEPRRVPHKAQIERTVSAGMPVGEVLLSRVADLGADLIVMGAYGHSRAREVLLGGATRSVLRSMTVPVLMSH